MNKKISFYDMRNTPKEAGASAKWHFSAIKYIVSV